MTYQPPPPPPGAGGAPAKFDPKAINPLDWGIIGAGVLAFLFSFIAFYSGVDVTDGDRTVTVDDSGSAWNDVIGGGFFAWFAMLFAVLGAAAVAVGLFRPQVQLPRPARLIGLGLFALATLFEIIALFVTPGDSQSFAGNELEASANHGFGYWVSLIVIIAGLALSLVRFQSTGGQLPGGLQGKVPNVGGYDKQGGINPGQQNPPPPAGGPPPPPPGYGPPQ